MPCPRHCACVFDSQTRPKSRRHPGDVAAIPPPTLLSFLYASHPTERPPRRICHREALQQDAAASTWTYVLPPDGKSEAEASDAHPFEREPSSRGNIVSE